MRLLSLYKSILESLNVQADTLGLLTHRSFDGQTEPVSVTVDGKSRRLVLPSPDMLSSGLSQEVVAFHPLSEVSNRGESEVFKRLKTMVSLRLTMTLMVLLEDLTELAANKSAHASLPPKLHGLLEAMPNADQKLLDSVQAILAAAVQGGKNRLINLYMKRGGTHQGRNWSRLAVVSFPILEELDNPDRKVFGVQLRVKDVPQIKALFDLVLPNSDVAGTYNAASDSMDAPYFEALMLAYAKLGAALNSIIKIAGKHIEDGNELKMDLKWVNELADIAEMRFEIPALDGNKGISLKSSSQEPEVEAVSASAHQSHVTAPVQEQVQETFKIKNSTLSGALPDEQTDSIKAGFSSEQLRANMAAMSHRSPAQETFQKLGQPVQPPQYESSGKRFSDIVGSQPAAPMYPGYPAPGHAAPVYPAPGYPAPGYGQAPVAAPGYYQPAPGYPVAAPAYQPADPFRQINTAGNRPQVLPQGQSQVGWG